MGTMAVALAVRVSARPSALALRARDQSVRPLALRLIASIRRKASSSLVGVLNLGLSR
jgi:hypothetical protein